MDLGLQVLDRVAGGRIFDLFHSLGSAGALYALLAPYFVSFAHHHAQRQFSETVLRSFEGTSPTGAGDSHVAHFTDTLDDVNGVAHTLRQQLAAAQALARSTPSWCAATTRNRRARASRPSSPSA
jgi:hypothetical protein